MASIVSDEKTAVNLIGGPLISEESFFPLFGFSIFYVSLTISTFTTMCFIRNLFVFIIYSL